MFFHVLHLMITSCNGIPTLSHVVLLVLITRYVMSILVVIAQCTL